MRSSRGSSWKASNAEIGRDFEKMIDDRVEGAKVAGWVRWSQRNEVGYRRRGREFIPAARAGTDWAGFFFGALSWGIECKSVAPGKRLAKSEVRERQVDHLEALEGAGAVALLAVEFREEAGLGQRFLAPWRAFPWVKHGGGYGAGPEDLAGWELIGEGLIFAPFAQRCASCRIVTRRGSRLACSCAAGGDA